mmetsp:Transcript_43751/g.79878  ORF Transcript_43751/g.79878 Transcript_43751/m.79878 type:complete len:297 (+) Transcript_43751:39-929(+)
MHGRLTRTVALRCALPGLARRSAVTAQRAACKQILHSRGAAPVSRQICWQITAKESSYGLQLAYRYVQQRHAATRRAQKSYYELLGVPRTATAKEIKAAYVREAKKWHPDVNPAPEATEHFKQLAEAYSTLSNASSREAYDRRGAESSFGSSNWHQHPGSASNADAGNTPPFHEEVDPDELFKSILQELGVEQVLDYLKKVANDASAAADAAGNGDMIPARAFIWNHKALFATIVLPAAVLLRFPAVVGMVMRGVMAIALVFLRDPRLAAAFGNIFWLQWQVVVQRARARARNKQR